MHANSGSDISTGILVDAVESVIEEGSVPFTVRMRRDGWVGVGIRRRESGFERGLMKFDPRTVNNNGWLGMWDTMRGIIWDMHRSDTMRGNGSGDIIQHDAYGSEPAA
jgi:hypothetical protein